MSVGPCTYCTKEKFFWLEGFAGTGQVDQTTYLQSKVNGEHILFSQAKAFLSSTTSKLQ